MLNSPNNWHGCVTETTLWKNGQRDLMAFHVFFLNQSSESDAEAMGE